MADRNAIANIKAVTDGNVIADKKVMANKTKTTATAVNENEMPELKIIRMSDVQSEPVAWLWEPYIPYGAISLIQGDGEMGKTTLSLAIAAAVTRGEVLPAVSDIAEGYRVNGDSCRDRNGDGNEYGGGETAPAFLSPANVIIQNGEDSLNRTIKPRLEKLGADCDRIFSIDDEDIALTYTDKRIEQTILETNAKLVIIDPIQAFWGKANMNAANGVRPVLKQLGAVAERTGCAIILVGHLRKSGGRASYRGLGSIDIFAAARSVLTVGRVDMGSNIRAVVHNKSNLAPSGPAQTFGLDPVTGFYWAGETDVSVDDVMNGRKRKRDSDCEHGHDYYQRETKSDEAQSFIMAMLQNRAVPSADILRMAQERGVAEKTLQRAKAELGVYSRKIDGVWCWDMPIDCADAVNYEDGHGQGGLHGHNLHNQHGHNFQDGHRVPLAMLTDMTTLPKAEVAESGVD